MTGGGGLRFPFSCTPLPGTLRATDSQVTVITLLFYLGKNKNKPLHDVDYTMQSKAELAVFSQNPNCCHGPRGFLLVQSGPPVTWE